MRYLFAFLLPPLAVLLCRRPGQALFNLVVWLVSIPLVFAMGLGLLLWLACTVHALAACRMSSLDKRLDRLVDAIHSRPPPPISYVPSATDQQTRN